MSESFIENYKAKHQHPLNKLTHSIGIPLIVISLPLFLFNWRWALLLFVVGWILQFVGHAVEGNRPSSGGRRLNKDFSFQVRLVYVLYPPRD